MNSILISIVLVTFIVVGANAIFHIRPNGQLIFFDNPIKFMSYSDGEKFCKSIGGQYPKFESKQDVDELSEIVLKHKKNLTGLWIPPTLFPTGYWIPLKQDVQRTFTWTDGSPYDRPLAKRAFEKKKS